MKRSARLDDDMDGVWMSRADYKYRCKVADPMASELCMDGRGHNSHEGSGRLLEDAVNCIEAGVGRLGTSAVGGRRLHDFPTTGRLPGSGLARRPSVGCRGVCAAGWYKATRKFHE